MAAAVLATVVLQMILPHRQRVPLWWIFPALEVGLLVALILGDPGRIDRRSPRLRLMTILLVAVMTIGNTAAAIILVSDILRGTAESATLLLGRGAAIWFTNVIVFSLWFWEYDRGGPSERAARSGVRISFMFAEDTAGPLVRPGWMPTYPDYLYLAFTNATAFSPTDTLPVRHWAKLTMMLESSISLVVAILVVARAINILPVGH
jgi:hypothetical protein